MNCSNCYETQEVRLISLVGECTPKRTTFRARYYCFGCKAGFEVNTEQFDEAEKMLEEGGFLK